MHFRNIYMSFVFGFIFAALTGCGLSPEKLALYKCNGKNFERGVGHFIMVIKNRIYSQCPKGEKISCSFL